MKKWLVFILLLVTTLGTLVPFCQIDNCCADEITNTANDDSHGEEGLCSPFITCGTCLGFTQLAKIVELPALSVDKPVHHSMFTSSILSSYVSVLLQPPRIG